MKKQILALCLAASFSTSIFAKKIAYRVADIDEDTTELSISSFETKITTLSEILNNYPNITCLDIDASYHHSYDHNIRRIQQLTQALYYGHYITRIKINYDVWLFCNLAEHLLSLSNLKHLELTDLHDHCGSKLIEALKKFNFLISLNLSGNCFTSTKIIKLIKILQSYTNLKYLDLRMNCFRGKNFGKAGAIALARALQNHSNLEYLNLNNNNIGDKGVIVLARALQNHSNFRILHLESNNISKKGAIALAQTLQNHSNFEFLSLVNNKIDDEGTIALAQTLQNHPYLKHLDLRCTRFTETGAIALAQTLKHLRYLKCFMFGSKEHNINHNPTTIILAQTLKYLPNLTQLAIKARRKTINIKTENTIVTAIENHKKLLKYNGPGSNNPRVVYALKRNKLLRKLNDWSFLSLEDFNFRI